MPEFAGLFEVGLGSGEVVELGADQAGERQERRQARILSGAEVRQDRDQLQVPSINAVKTHGGAGFEGCRFEVALLHNPAAVGF